MNNVIRGLFGNQPADEGLRLGVPCIRHQTRGHLNEARQERIALRAVFHQQTTGASTALSGGDKRRLDRQMYSGVKIIRIFNNQGIVTAHFQRQDFLRLTCQLAMQLISRSRTAGE